MSNETSVLIPQGYALTITANAVSAARYWALNNPGEAQGSVTELAAGASVTIAPFNSAQTYQIESDTGSVSYSIAQSGVYTAVDEAAQTTSLALKQDKTITKVSNTEATNAVTASGLSGKITTSALTTAAGLVYSITWTNTNITATSVILLSVMGGTNTTYVDLKAVAGSGSATISIQNIDLVNALNGTIIIGYLVV